MSTGKTLMSLWLFNVGEASLAGLELNALGRLGKEPVGSQAWKAEGISLPSPNLGVHGGVVKVVGLGFERIIRCIKIAGC